MSTYFIEVGQIVAILAALLCSETRGIFFAMDLCSICPYGLQIL